MYSIDKSYKHDDFVNKGTHHIWDELSTEEQEDEVCKLHSHDDRYIDKVLIGTGALKSVYCCYDTQLKLPVALAETKPGLGVEYDEQLIYEAWLTADLHHANIIGVHNIGKNEDGRPYFIMDLKSNFSLSDFLKDDPSVTQRLHVFLKVCEAIQYAHFKGVLHLDLKPENIQVGDFGEVLVCDWGLGKKNKDFVLEGEVHNTLYGQIKGSIGYMAPEQAVKNGVKDHRTDVYGLGSLLYFVLTKQVLYTGTKEEFFTKLEKGEYSSPRKRFSAQRVDKTLDSILRKSLKSDPEQRYQSVESLQSDIENYLSGHSTSTEKSNYLRRAFLFYSRHKMTSNILLMTGVVAYFLLSVFDDKLNSKQQEIVSLEKLTEETQEELPNIYYDSLGNRKQFFWNGNPITYYEREYELVNRILEYAPHHSKALLNKAELDFMVMNFKALNEVEFPKEGNWESFYHSIGSDFPNFAYSSNVRPSYEVLLSVFEKLDFSEHKIPLHTKNRLRLSLMRFDWYNRTDTEKDAYNEVVTAVINGFRRREGAIRAIYNKEENSVELNCKGTFAIHGGKNILSYYRLNSLKLNISGVLKLSELKGLHAREVDFVNCKQFNIESSATIYGLEVLKVKDSEAESFQDLIHSEKIYEIQVSK